MPQTEAARRAARAFVLRSEGLTYAIIAERLDYPDLESVFLAVAKLAGRDDTISPVGEISVEKTAEQKAEARRVRRRDAARVKRVQAKQETLETPEQLAARLTERYAAAS